MYKLIEMTVIMIITLEVKCSLLQGCQNQRGELVSYPQDIEISCETDKVAQFPCQFEYKDQNYENHVRHYWIINNVSYDTKTLPPDHFYDGKVLSVRNLKLEQNNSHYQCAVEFLHLSAEEEIETCLYKSAVGHLIMRCRATIVQCEPSYDYGSNMLKKVLVNVTQITGLAASYIISYTNAYSGVLCGSVYIPATSCSNGSCIHTSNTSTELSHCSTDILVMVSREESDAEYSFIQPKPIKLDYSNSFIQISFDNSMRIHCTFVNQQKENKKFYTIQYGPVRSGCKDLPAKISGYISHSNSIVLPLILNSSVVDICFVVTAVNDIKTVTVTGIHKFVPIYDVTTMAVHATHVAFATVVVCGLVVTINVILLFCFVRHLKASNQNSYHEDGSDGEQNKEFKSKKVEIKQKKVDLSSTFFQQYMLHEDVLMHKFATSHYPHYQPKDGHGFYLITTEEIKDIKLHKKLLLMDKTNSFPKFVDFSSSIEKYSDQEWGDVYVRDKSLTRELTLGTKFLYCARSKTITNTAFWKEYDVTEECNEIQFVMEKIREYQMEWKQYGYLEFTKPERIKSHQRVIVKKKSGDLVTGPGIYHLLGIKGDSANVLQPPDFTKHEQWERVFIQSRKTDRKLLPNTKYLFCAMMDRISTTVHYDVYNIHKRCNMAKFGRRHIPGFRPELGYGFFEFKQEEYLKPHKAVILVDKEKRLFTGAGAQFFCYSFNEVINGKIRPPKLVNTRWTHIFIQSHSEARELLPNTKFLYCEYHFQAYNKL